MNKTKFTKTSIIAMIAVIVYCFVWYYNSNIKVRFLFSVIACISFSVDLILQKGQKKISFILGAIVWFIIAIMDMKEMIQS